MKGVTAQSGQVNKVGGEVERNMDGVSGKFQHFPSLMSSSWREAFI